jgi:hypothetical protein
MANPNARLSSSPPAVEREWDKLTKMVLAERVVPTIGPELLMVDGSSGQPESLYDRWGKALAAQSELTVPAECSIPLLYYVTNRRSLDQRADDLAFDIDYVVQQEETPVPPTLQKLAEMNCFQLYLTTTIDHQLKRALAGARESDGGVRQVLFSPKGSKAVVDLPDISDGRPTVFHLFGATSPVETEFAKTEDDLIEFSWALLDKSYGPQRLYDYLSEKTVLLLGCHFPDWLGRFLIYALHGSRPDAPNVYYVGSHIEPGLEDFLRRRKATILRVPRVTDFVDELHRRWLLHKPSPRAPAPDERTMKRGAVFLSYAREDRAIVNRIREQLEDENIDTWMDESGLEPGADYQQVLHDNIRDAAFFVAIISRTLDTSDGRGRFLWREWKWAADVNQDRRQRDCFLQPLCIDDTPAGARFVEPPMRELQWTRLRAGRLPEDFVRSLKAGIRNFRRTQ